MLLLQQWDDLINEIESQAIHLENNGAAQSYIFLIAFLTVNKVCDLSFQKILTAVGCAIHTY
jgi:hypothetical protein